MKNKKRLLISGAGIDQVPAIQLAKEMGYFTIAIDLNPNAIGFQYADKSFAISTTDYKGTYTVAKEEMIDGIMTLISETAVPTVARVAEDLKLPGIPYSSAIAATNKNVMAKTMKDSGVPMPKSTEIFTESNLENAFETIKAPWIIKPSDSSGQRGIIISENKNVIRSCFNNSISFSTDKAAIIQEYIEGKEMNVTTVIIDGHVHIVSISHRVILPSPHFGIAVEHIAPPDISKNEIEEVKQIAINSSLALKISNGITYPQIIVNPNGSRLVEIAARIPGGNMPDIALFSGGVNLMKVAILQALNEPININTIITEHKYKYVQVKLFTELDFPDNIQIIKKIEGVETCLSNPNVKLCQIRLNPGDQIPKLTNGVGRFASVVVATDSKEEIQKSIDHCISSLKIF